MIRTRFFTFAFHLALLVAMLGCQPPSQATTQPAGGLGPGTIAVYFSSQGGCTEAAVTEITRATKSIKVQAYSFTSAPIAKALVDAHKRGVDVAVVLDKSQRTERYSSATFLFNSGVPTYIDARHAIAHNKIMIIDGETILTGSFNFTKAAEESNAENLLVIKGNPELVEKYAKNFEAHQGHSEKYEGRAGQ